MHHSASPPRSRARLIRVVVLAALYGAAAVAQAQSTTADEIAKYRAMLQDGNPAELVAMRGEELWKTPNGPKKVSLEQCDLGQGPGKIKGAYAQMPRYFADADAVMDFESRLVWCMETLQGIAAADAKKNPFSGAGQRQTDIEAITAFIVENSRGAKIAVPQSHPKEKAAFARGEQLFYQRGGPFDFSCSTCHARDDQRIRLQDLPNLNKQEPARKAFAQWPAYRVSQGALRTMQWRLNDCFRQQRWPYLEFTSPASVDLITFLGVNANGGIMESPAIKR